MIHRIAGLLCIVAFGCSGLGGAPVVSHAASSGTDLAGLCPTVVGHPLDFTSASGLTEVVVCASVVQSGSPVQLVVLTHRFATVQLQLQFPDGTFSPASGPLVVTARANGLVPVKLTKLDVTYNPVAGYVQVPLNVTATWAGQKDAVSNATVTVAQVPPLASVVLRARPDNGPATDWCTGSNPNAPACSIRDHSRVVLQVTTDPYTQVTITLTYPDGTPITCQTNTLTGTALTSPKGVFVCRLPVVFPLKGSASAVLTVSAEASAPSVQKTATLQLNLIGQ